MPQTEQPNILVLRGNDIGWYNISHNNRGAMGYQTPNIDRIAREGVEFTDYYAQQSCTAGRAAFITGQNPVRTGLTKVGIPGAEVGLAAEDPTIAELLKPLGYTTGQFGKNHLGDRDEHLPTNHGFDEFYGNLYHLNAEDEPEHPDYPKDPAFRERFGPRGVIHSFADGRIEDTGPLTKKRMETIDDDVTERAIAFIREAHAADTPFFVWWNSTHMHVWTRIPEEAEGISGQGFYNDAMVLHDADVSEMLGILDELGIVAKLQAGHQAGDKTFKVQIDGYNGLPYLLGETDESPREWFFYTNDDGLVVAIRYGDWKAVFYEQRAKTLQLWAESFVALRLPKLFNLRRDPFERADENANGYWDWLLEHVFVIYPMQALAAEQLQSFKEFPPRQKPAAFNLDMIIEKMTAAGDGGLH